MGDFIRVEHYLDYLNYRLQERKAESEFVKAKYANAKVRYEAKFLPRLFNWKFEDSYDGDTGWFAGRWNFYEDNIEILENEINRVTYLSKTGSVLVSVGNRICINRFYNWCKEKGLP